MNHGKESFMSEPIAGATTSITSSPSSPLVVGDTVAVSNYDRAVSATDRLKSLGIEELGKQESVSRVQAMLKRSVVYSQLGTSLVCRSIQAFTKELEYLSVRQFRNVFSLVIKADGDLMALAYVVMTECMTVGFGNASGKPAYQLATFRAITNAVSRHINICLIKLRDAATDGKAYRNLMIAIKKTDSKSRVHRTKVTQRYIRMYYENADSETVTLDPEVMLLMSSVLIDTLVSSTGLCYWQLFRPNTGHKINGGYNAIQKVLTIHPAVIQWLDKQTSRLELLSPTMYPTLVPAEPWTAWNKGGYQSLPSDCTLFVRHKRFASEVAFAAGSTTSRRVADILGSTAFSINQRVLEFAWNNRDSIGLPDSVMPPSVDTMELPVRPWTTQAQYDQLMVTNPTAIKEWKQKATAEYQRLLGSSTRSKRISMRLKMLQARTMLAESADTGLFFPHNTDFRGRYYPMTTWLSPQSDDFGKSILQFRRGAPVTDANLKWLLVHGANCAGVDKVSYEERVQWCIKNHRNILDTARNPMGMKDFWTALDSPWLFLAFCYAYDDVHRLGSKALVHIPISFDGTCNGLQHYSAMLRDEVGGRETNLVPSDKPSDLYTTVAKKTQKLIEDDDDPDNSEHKRYWLQEVGGITRKLAKRNTMTTPYGVTMYGMRDQLINDFEDDFGKDINKHAHYLARKTHEAIASTVVAASVGMGFLKAVATRVIQSGFSLSWTTPIGFFALQHYVKQEVRDLEFITGKVRLCLRVPDETKETSVNKGKNVMAFSPNFIHSMDAAHLGATVLKLHDEYGVREFAMIHDSYGTTIDNADLLQEVLRERFVTMYELHDPFAELLEAYAKRGLDVSGLTVPQRGALDLRDNVLKSRYFFS